MLTQRKSRGPLWGFMFVVLLNNLLSKCICETPPSINNLNTGLEVDAYFTVSNSSTDREYISTAVSQDKNLIVSRIPGDLRLENKSSATQSVNNNQSSSAYSREENAESAVINDDQGGVERSPSGPSLSDGGGIAGAISRVVGLVPMLVTRLTSKLGLSRRRRDLSEEERAAHADPSLPQQHLEIIQNLNRYYSSLNNSTKVKDRPTLEQLKAHREYLLHLLQQMKHNNKGKVDNPNDKWTKLNNSSSETDYGKNLLQDELKSLEHLSLISSSQNVSSVFQNENENRGNGTKEHYSPPAYGVDVENASLAESKNGEKDEENSHNFSSRLGQAITDHSDIQTEDVDKVALLLHQFQTQGDVSLFPNNFLEKLSSMAKNPIRRLNLFQTTPPTLEKTSLSSELQGSASSRQARRFSQQPYSIFSNSPTKSLTSANIDPITGYHHLPSGSPNSSPAPSVVPIRVLNPENYNPVMHSLPGSTSSQATFSSPPALRPVQQLGQAGKPLIPQSSSDVHNLPAVSDSTRILDKYPDKSTLIDPQNIPDLLEGLKIIESSGQSNPPQSFPDLIQNLPVEFFMNTNLFSDYDTLINALRIMQQQNNFQVPSNPDRKTSPQFQPQNLLELTRPSVQSFTNINRQSDPGHFQSSESAIRPQTYPVRGNPVPNTRLTTELNTAFTNLVDNTVLAITTFLNDLASAITATPALLLLGLIPFTILILSLYHHYGASLKGGQGYSSGGYSSGGHNTYGRNSFKPRRPDEEVDLLARQILDDITTFERWAKSDYT